MDGERRAYADWIARRMVQVTRLPDSSRIAAKVQACKRRIRMAVHRALAVPDVKKKYEYYRRDTHRPDPRD